MQRSIKRIIAFVARTVRMSLRNRIRRQFLKKLYLAA